MKRLRRNYYLDNQRILSSEVDGFLYTRKRDIKSDCMGCEKPIIKGQKYVIINYFDTPDPIHFDCFAKPCILGVKQGRQMSFGLMRGFVICKKFTVDETKRMNQE